MSENKNPQLSTDQISKIDQAIASAQANKAKRNGESPPGNKADKPKRPRLSPEERTSRDLVRDQEKLQKKEARVALREAKKAEKEANKVPAHMKKVLKAAENLPALDSEAEVLFKTAVDTMDLVGLDALARNLEHVVRSRRTESALATKLKVGEVVRITGGAQRFIGMTATVEKVQRIRCYVTVAGFDKPVYLFTSDVSSLSDETAESVDETSRVSKTG